MPVVGFLCDPEGQCKQQLRNIWLGRSHGLKGKVITGVLLNGFLEFSCFHITERMSQEKASWVSLHQVSVRIESVLDFWCGAVEKTGSVVCVRVHVGREGRAI